MKPLENDNASDFKLDFEEANKDVSILENVFDTILNAKKDKYLEVRICEQAVASSQILNDLFIDGDGVFDENKKRLLDKSSKALKRILEKSELKELWEEAGDNYEEWVKILEKLIK